MGVGMPEEHRIKVTPLNDNNARLAEEARSLVYSNDSTEPDIVPDGYFGVWEVYLDLGVPGMMHRWPKLDDLAAESNGDIDHVIGKTTRDFDGLARTVVAYSIRRYWRSPDVEILTVSKQRFEHGGKVKERIVREGSLDD